jgi:hypothetical protein
MGNTVGVVKKEIPIEWRFAVPNLRATGSRGFLRGMRESPVMLLAFSCALAHAQEPPESYTAEQTVNVGGKVSVSILHVTRDAVRLEDKHSGVITIVRSDRKVIWALLPAQRTYLELPWDSFAPQLAQSKPTAGAREALGSDQIAGYNSAKARVHMVINGADHVTFEWTAPELGGLVIKRADPAGKWSVTYSSVSPGPQSAALFDLPAGYDRMSMPAMNH